MLGVYDHAYLYCFVPINEAYSVSPASANKYLNWKKEENKISIKDSQIL